MLLLLLILQLLVSLECTTVHDRVQRFILGGHYCLPNQLAGCDGTGRMHAFIAGPRGFPAHVDKLPGVDA